MYLRCHESDYEEEPLFQPIDDHAELIGSEKINKESTLQIIEPNLIETARSLNKKVEFLQPENIAVLVEEGNN